MPIHSHDHDHDDIILRSSIGRGPKGHSVSVDVIEGDPDTIYRVQFKDSVTGEVLETTPNLKGQSISVSVVEGDPDTSYRLQFENAATGEILETTPNLKGHSVSVSVVEGDPADTYRLRFSDATTGEVLATSPNMDPGARVHSYDSNPPLGVNDGPYAIEASLIDSMGEVREDDYVLYKGVDNNGSQYLCIGMVSDVTSTYVEFDEYFKIGITVDYASLAANISTSSLQTAVAPSVPAAVDAWLTAHPEATTTVQDGAITTAKLHDGAVTDAKLVQTGGVLSANNNQMIRSAESYPYTNLFDKDSANRRDGVYYVYTSGTCSANADYSSYIMPVLAGKTISVCGMKYAHITFFSKCVDVRNVTAGTIPNGFISGMTTGNNWRFDNIAVPSEAAYVIVSLHTDQINNAQVSYGTTTGMANRDPFGLEAKKVDAITGKNILDLTTNARSGCYFNGTSGAYGANASYSACMVPVSAGDVLSFNSSCSNAHVAFVSMWSDLSDYVTYTTLSGFISGFANDAKQNFTVPDGAVAMVFSYANARAGLVQVEKASTSTAYEPYWKGVNIQKNVYGILPVGAGMRYATISDAVTDAGGNDIVLVFPGTYTESVHAWGKYVNIIGMSRDECILTYGGGDYANPPLEMSHGTLANMTIHTTYEETTGSAPAYCMHIEDSTAVGSSFYVSNVRFINDKHQTVGIGLRNNYIVTFENCIFENNAGRNALYCHDYETATTGLNNQNIQLVNCSFRNSSATIATIALQSQEIENNRAHLTAQRCIVKNAGGGAEISMTKWQGRDQGGGNFMNSTDWLLDDMSALNTLATINA